MPRHYKRKTVGYQFENLKRAVDDVRNKRLSVNNAVKFYAVPRTTIYDHLNEEIITQPRRGSKFIFTETREKRLEEHILKCNQLYNVLTANFVRKAAFKYAEAYKLKNNFDKTLKMTGKDWYYGFMKRHPNIIVLSTRKLESTGDFSEAEVLRFFDNLIAQEIRDNVDTEIQRNHVPLRLQRKRKREKDERGAIGVIRTYRRNAVNRRDGEIIEGDTMNKAAPELYKIEKNNSALRELGKQILGISSRKNYWPYSRIKEKKVERFRNVESEPEVSWNAEIVETSDPLEALAVPGPSRYNIYSNYDDTTLDKEVYDQSESMQEIPPSKTARKDPCLQLPTLSMDFEIKEENTVQDSTRTPEETLADFSIVSQDEVSEGNSSSDVILPRFPSKAVSDSDSSGYFKARSIQKAKQKITTEVLFQRYKLKSKREIDRLHSKIRELKASVAKYKRQVYRLQQRRDDVIDEK